MRAKRLWHACVAALLVGMNLAPAAAAHTSLKARPAALRPGPSLSVQLPAGSQAATRQPDAGMISPPQALSGIPGDTIQFSVGITNTTGATESYTLTLGAHTWPAVLNVSQVELLEVGASTAVTVSVQVPEGSLLGASDTMTLTAQSWADPPITATTTLTATAAALYGVHMLPAQAKSTLPGTIVQYQVLVTNTGNATGSYTMTLGAHTWPATLDLTQVGPLNVGTPALVIVTVEVPENVPALSQETVAITATSRQDSSKTAVAALTTTAGTMFSLQAITQQTRSGTPGQVIPYTLWVTNTGNAQDTFNVTLGAQQWSTTLSGSSVGPLAVGQAGSVQARVTVPDSAVIGVQGISRVTVTSQGDPTQKLDITLLTGVLPVYDCQFSPGSAALSGEPGTTITYTVRITNTGNALDTFMFTPSGNQWAVTPPSGGASLSPGAAVNVSLAVSIPPDAGYGTSDQAVVTITSNGDYEEPHTFTLNTSVPNRWLFLPMVGR